MGRVSALVIKECTVIGFNVLGFDQNVDGGLYDVQSLNILVSDERFVRKDFQGYRSHAFGFVRFSYLCK